ncbi:conserved hypothetical protein [Vibrio crassostreae]|uniref:hypothetical protein n=1 Tax=Vibrio crassostreae TaxID=246167 RepID=UPI001043FDB7|nr:hypothetical protein [Vibrio crassostreae]TCT55850.1 hypothetical protein EDB44_13610 [Vibrio crassostreae]TCT75390.1 hypothetical protein EDB43_1364 [Vibrio crassostreae]TCT95952.1 hypothetical protein EDB47_14110 [Vibrio crassostreae]CAK2110487.1 conserved hypothetical protein [Vibrio crassostreae]CAK2121301.1 conserved hypothetical protein [Vibrio crassostreae]
MNYDKYLIYFTVVLVSLSGLSYAAEFKLPSDIQFIGTVVDTTPNWRWRVGASANAWAKDWDSTSNDGIVVSRGVTLFNYSTRNADGGIVFVQGVMKSPASVARPEILPTVTIKGAFGNNVILNRKTESERISIDASGTLADGNQVDGILSFNIESAYAVSYKIRGNEYDYFMEYTGDSEGVGWAALSVLSDSLPANYKKNDQGGVMRSINLNKPVSYSIASVIDGSIAPKDSYAILGSFSSHLSQIHTEWTTVPKFWTSTLSVEVSIP